MSVAKFPLIEEILNCLEQIHSEMKNGVSLKSKNKELAIYVITGRILTHCHATINLLRDGFFTEAGILLRSIYESVFVAEYFYVSNPNDKVFKNWFNDKIIPPAKARKSQSKMAEKLNKAACVNCKMDVGRVLKLTQEIYKKQSEYIHPTYNISKMNLNHRNLEFDYKGEKIKKTIKKLPYSFDATMVMVLNMFCTCFDAFHLDLNIFNRLRGYVSQLEA